MPVVINDFEMVVEPPQQPASQPQPSAEASETAEMSAQQVEQMLKLLSARRARIRAD